MPVANPILPGCFPDPSICRVGEWHYLVASTFELLPGMPVMRSRDLATWETIGHVLDRPGMVDLAGIRSSGGIFAPTIRYDGERFWIVTTLVDPADGERGGTFLVTADDAAGPWSDPIWIEVAGIDPSLLFDDDGRVWMHGTRLVAEPEWHHQTEVWVRELSIDEGRLVGDEHVVWTGAVRGAVWAEGPHLLRIDGTCYLLAAEGGTAFEHAVCIARAEHPTGPFVGSPANPVLTHRQLGHGAEVQAVGHADLVQAPDGEWSFNDDADGLNPALRIENADRGAYDIWVGTYGDDNCHATLAMETFPSISPRPQPQMPEGVLPDPGNMTGYRGQNGQSFRFQVTGAESGSVWGTDVYTDDSVLARAAVHAGLLQPGETGVVTVMVLPGQERYDASYRNGVPSRAYGRWSGSYAFTIPGEPPSPGGSK